MVMGIAGACRTDEFCKMQISDITDNGKFVIVKIPETKNGIDRVFTIVDYSEEGINYIETFKKYFEIRKRITNNPRFFLRYSLGPCYNQPVGKHTFAKIPSKIANFFNLVESDLYTGHCFRRTSATLLANSGVDTLGLKRHGGWKSSSIAESYVAESISNKLEIANKIFYNKSTGSNNKTAAQLETDEEERN